MGWIGNVGFIVGVTLLGRRVRYGFMSCAFGNACYALRAAVAGDYSLLTLSCVLIGLNLHSFAKWGKTS